MSQRYNNLLVVVHVKDMGALDPIKDNRLPAYRLECAHRAVDTSGKKILSLLKYLKDAAAV